MSPTRRDALRTGLAAAAGLALPSLATADDVSAATPISHDDGARRATPPYKQSVARWCFGSMPIDALCREAKRIGLDGIDLLSENEWSVPAQHGLVCTVANGPGPIADGWNRPDLHDRLVADSERLIPLVAAAGIPQMIVFSGNRRGMSDGEGIANCVAGLKRIVPLAERHGVTLVMEMLNSKVDHRDYHADRTAWAAEVARGLNTPRFKLLYDVYHMQIMEGDVIRTIRQYAPLIGHYHTAGNPGRNELDASQELNYAAIAQAIAATGFTGFVAHEFIPRRAPGLEGLAEAQRIFAG